MPGCVLGIDGTEMNDMNLFVLWGLHSNGGRQTTNEWTTKSMSGGDKYYEGKVGRKRGKKVMVGRLLFYMRHWQKSSLMK